MERYLRAHTIIYIYVLCMCVCVPIMRSKKKTKRGGGKKENLPLLIFCPSRFIAVKEYKCF